MNFLERHRKEIKILFKITKSYIEGKFEVEIFDLEYISTKSRKRPVVYARKIMMIHKKKLLQFLDWTEPLLYITVKIT